MPLACYRLPAPRSIATVSHDWAAYTRTIPHSYGFDPSHGYTLADLLKIPAPVAPEDFETFWSARYAAATTITPKIKIQASGSTTQGWKIHDIAYTSTGDFSVAGWLLVPESGRVERACIIGHGYGGRAAPDTDFNLPNTALLFPCARGLGRSQVAGISSDPAWHVLHHIENKNQYILGDCVADLWLGVSVLLEMFPQVTGHIGYMGTSFGGGIGALAVAWEPRITRAHLNVPSFGNQPLRAQLASVGSAASVQAFLPKCPAAQHVLAYYDAASAARFIQIPMFCACALFDPAVAPAGQFAIYNALSGPKELFILAAGHHPYALENRQAIALKQEIHTFFHAL